MANLLAEWLLVTNLNIEDVKATVENNLHDMIIKHFDPKKADSILSDENKVFIEF